jgi:hypothetical protein
MSNLKHQEKEKMQETLNEILDQNISVDSFLETSEKSLETAEYEKVNNMLLEYYDKSNKFNFQENLKGQLKLMVNEKMLSKMENVDDLEVKEEREISEEVDGVDKKTLEEASKNVEEKEQENKDEKNNAEEFDLRAELMKQIYIEEFKKYANTLYKLKESQIERDELTVGDKEGTELVLHENYLKNIERNYMGYAKLRGLDEKTLSDNEEIKDMKKDLNEKIGKAENESKEAINKKIERVKDLTEKRQEIANKMNEISNEGLEKTNPGKYKELMDEYQKEYRMVTYEIREESPTLEEYTKQIEIEQENIEFADRYAITPDNSDIVAGNVITDKKDIYTEDTEGTPENKVKDTVVKEDETIANNIDDYMKEIEVQIGQGRFEKAEELLQSTEEILEIKDNQEEEASEEKDKDSNEKIDEDLDDEKEENDKKMKDADLSDERGYWKSASLQDDDVSKKDELNRRLKFAREKFKEKFPEYSKQQEKNMSEIAKEKQLD